ncbi:hypothetical protein ACHQM5_004688 [Ranunculus cassubicifolius]
MAAASSFLHFTSTSIANSSSSMFSSSTSRTRVYISIIKASSTSNINMVQIKTSWAGDINSEVDAHINRALADGLPTNISEPMSYLLRKTPKSMAPALCIAACEAVGGDKEQAIPAASALHLMHVATFSHEHLQLTDQPRRRAMPHHGLGPKRELIAADNMVPIGYQLLAAAGHDTKPEYLVRVMVEIGKSMGAQGMVNGVYLKLKCMGLISDEVAMEEDAVYEAIENLGGALYSCGGACGAILGGGSDEEVEKLRRFGVCVGIIHNIMIHDILGTDKIFLKLADSLRFLALQELQGMKDHNVERLSSILDGFSAFLTTQEYQFPN